MKKSLQQKYDMNQQEGQSYIQMKISKNYKNKLTKHQNEKHKQSRQLIYQKKEKQSTSSYSQQQQSNNRLMKTQLPPKGKQSLNSTQYNKLPPNTPTIKRLQSTKSSNSSSNNTMLPKQGINYDIENNMTESKIISAKESLQLLKKKMNRTGMSRQKPSAQSSQNIPMQQKTSNNSDSMKKIKQPDSNKNIQTFQPTTTKYSSHSSKNYEQQQQSYNATYEPKSYKAPVVKKPTQQIQKPQMKKTTSISQDYYNQLDQAPISTKKQSFQAMIQRQLKKEQQAKGLSNNNNNFGGNAQRNQPKMQLNQYPDEDEVGELFQCGKGCGRQFNEKVLAKHQKICQKVFQSKRKAFNTAAQRQVQNQAGFQKPQEPYNKFNQTKKPAQKKENKIPKWKLQSAQLRVGLKAVSNKPLTKQQEALTKMQSDNLVPCNHCGRKFNQKAAARHIPSCANKAKQQVNRAPVAKKR